MRRARHWDVFCRVVDNFGDVGVAWRLCADLAARGEGVRLWIDDASALRWMAPRGAPGVEVVEHGGEPPDLAPGDVAVETFGCGLPPRFLQRLADAAPPAVWIDVEYLSAEPYVERSHGLPSPVRVDADRWLTKRFFFPGFTLFSGGLLREAGLLDARRGFDRGAWLAAHGVAARPGERLASLFCYDAAPVAALLERLAGAPTLLLAAPGAAASRAAAVLGASLRRGALRAHALPWLAQPDYDRLLWSCDLNFVRGEDSFVRAQWAGVPFVWQAYPQPDDAHAAKLAAFLDRLLDGAEPSLAAGVRAFWAGWNALAPTLPPLPPADAWSALALRWRDGLAAQSDLAARLIACVERDAGTAVSRESDERR